MKQKGSETYLARYPELKRWMNTCACCGATGYRPDMPEALTTRAGREEIETRGAQNIRRLYPPLRVNGAGLCENCERLLARDQR